MVVRALLGSFQWYSGFTPGQGSNQVNCVQAHSLTPLLLLFQFIYSDFSCFIGPPNRATPGGSWGHMWCLGLNLVQLCAKQAPYLLYFFLVPWATPRNA